MNTQIYATFGPSCGEEGTLENMIRAGMTGMRLNLSHVTLEESAPYIHAYQSAAKTCNVKPQVLIDMQGPELRIGKVQEELLLEPGGVVHLVGGVHVSHAFKAVPVPQEVLHVVQVGDIILLDDSKMKLEVMDKTKDLTLGICVKAKVIHGGILKSYKSIKIRDRYVEMPVLTERDLENLDHAKAYGVTALMQPFALCGQNLRDVKNVLRDKGIHEIQIFAKIENRIGVEHLDEILPEADVIVIARGDLGNDMPLWELPAVQKQIEDKCKAYKKPYIVVTQMLASMEQSPVPTRAEVSDIYHAVYHGAWGVMITGESAIGKYPVEAVKYLANVAATV